jgi:hypothetical protein
LDFWFKNKPSGNPPREPEPGLPEFSWLSKPKGENLPNDHNIYQMAIK